MPGCLHVRGYMIGACESARDLAPARVGFRQLRHDLLSRTNPGHHIRLWDRDLAIPFALRLFRGCDIGRAMVGPERHEEAGLGRGCRRHS